MAACKLLRSWRRGIAPLPACCMGVWRGELLPLLVGALFAQGARPSPVGCAAGGSAAISKAYYYFLGSLAAMSKASRPNFSPGGTVVEPGERLLLAIDDTPTKRYGPHVRRRGDSSQSDAGPSGPEVCLRPCVGDVVVGGAAYVVGNDRSACWLAVRAAEEHQEHRAVVIA